MDTKRAKQVGLALVDRQREHNVSLVAAGLAFYGMLTLIPAMVALVSVYGLVSDPVEVTEQVTDLTENLPVETAQFVRAQLTSVANGAAAGLGVSAVVAIGLALWSTSAAMAALIKGIGIAWADRTKRSIVQIRGAAIAMTIVTVVAVAITIGLVVLIPQALADAGAGARLVADGVRWLVTFALTIVALSLIYRFAPTSKEKRTRAASPGAVFATVVIVVGTFLFSALVPRFGSFNETYGALAGIILLLLWLYLCGFAVVLGAELDAELAPSRKKR